MLNYEKELNDIFRNILYEDWMDEDDYKKCTEHIQMDELSNAIEIGVQNGYSVEYQLSLIKKIFNIEK